MKPPSACPPNEFETVAFLASAVAALSRVRTVDDVLTALLRNVTACTHADEAILFVPDAEGRLGVRAGSMGSFNEASAPLDPDKSRKLIEILGGEGEMPSSEVLAEAGLTRRFGTSAEELAAIRLPLGNGCALLLASWHAPRRAGPDGTSILRSLAEMTSAVLENLQARHDLERLVEERTRSLQAVNDELQTFAYIVSHDLKNPLTIIKTCVWTLQQLPREELDERSGKAIDRIAGTVERMRDQIDGMLQMYRLTKKEVLPENLDLSAMALEILEELRSADKSRQVELRVAPDLSVRGDPTMLMVMMENLLGNAWKYSSKTADAIIEVGSLADGDGGTVFFVRDNGAGFNMDDAGRLFHVFQRLHPDDEFSGSGIGLASVQRIVNRHGGRVWAESEKGKGATFYFKLPEAIPSFDVAGEDAVAAFAAAHRTSSG